MLADELEARARALREVADAMGADESREALLRFAAEYEARAAAIREEHA